jgi:hypothetical protein
MTAFSLNSVPDCATLHWLDPADVARVMNEIARGPGYSDEPLALKGRG